MPEVITVCMPIVAKVLTEKCVQYYPYSEVEGAEMVTRYDPYNPGEAPSVNLI